MAFTVTVSSADGATPRAIPAAALAAATFEGERTADQGYGSFTLKLPLRFDQSLVSFGDRVEAFFGAVRVYRGYVRTAARGWDGDDTPTLTLTGEGVARVAYGVEVPGEYAWEPAIDRADAWEEVATDCVVPEMPALVLDAQTTGATVARVEGTYRAFREVPAQLLKGYEDLIVAGGDVEGDRTGDADTGDDRLFLRPASAAADYTFPVPDTEANARTLNLKGSGSVDGVYNSLRIRGGTPVYPQLFPNARLDRVAGGAADGGEGSADGLELAGYGTATVANVSWVGGGEFGKHALSFDATASDADENDARLQVAGGGSAVGLTVAEEPLRFEARVKGDWPKHILELEFLDANSARVGAVQRATFAANDYGSTFTTIAGTVASPPADAVAVIPRLRVRGSGTGLEVDAVSLRNLSAPAGEFLPNGPFTVKIDADDAALVSYGITAAAAASKADYTGGVTQYATLEDETAVDLASARAVAAAWFNRHAVPLFDPSFCRADDEVQYWPGMGVLLTGAQGSALMGGAAFLPIAAVKLVSQAYGGAYEQRIDLKRPRVSDEDGVGLARQQAQATRALISPTRAETPTPSTPGAAMPGGGGGGTGGGGRRIPPGNRPTRKFETITTLTAPTLTVEEHGVVTAIEDSGLEERVDALEGGIVLACVLGCRFRSIPDCYLKTGAKDTLVAQFKGVITGWRVETTGTGTITFGVARHPFSPTSPDEAPVSIVAAAPPTLSTGNSAASATLTGWTTAFEEGDEFTFEITARTGRVSRAVLYLDCTPGN